MDQEEQGELVSLLDALEREREPLIDFIPRISPGRVRPSHLAPLCDALDRSRDAAQNVCVSVPPGHGKTECVLHAIVQRLITYPSQLIGYVTYGDSLSTAKSLEARDIALRAGVQLRSDSASKHEWMTTAGGGLKATSINAGLTGRHVDFIVFDDPFKNRVEAESPSQRDKVHNFFTSTLTTRLREGGSRFVVHTRWHEDDLIGRLIRNDIAKEWTVINIPAIADADGKPADVGRVLMPPVLLPSGQTFGYSAATLAKRRAENEYDWHSLYQGQPRPRGGKVFSGDPVRYAPNKTTEGARIILSVDGAGTESKRADHSVGGAIAFYGVGDAMTCDVLDIVREQLRPEHMALKLYEFQQRVARGTPFYIESTRDGKEIRRALLLIEPKLKIVEWPPIGDKFIRAQPVATAWNQGRVRVPMHAPWLAAFLYELEKFTGIGDLQDDQVDMLSQAWNVAAAVGKVLKPRFGIAPAKETMG